MGKYEYCIEHEGVYYCWDDDKKNYFILDIRLEPCFGIPVQVAAELTKLIIERKTREDK